MKSSLISLSSNSLDSHIENAWQKIHLPSIVFDLFNRIQDVMISATFSHFPFSTSFNLTFCCLLRNIHSPLQTLLFCFIWFCLRNSEGLIQFWWVFYGGVRPCRSISNLDSSHLSKRREADGAILEMPQIRKAVKARGWGDFESHEVEEGLIFKWW